ncbi:amine oxidase flavin-containing superfamily [Penicillium angulare]|uniref:Amine oxidase flavin-containing superfamily n=1 Tax=Penicillium angulare TaxID=116970 RepID=A0A9W9FD09_9EURO|nr:amine oxidase flavin-containing superfamily [Penicillium angulare]
MSLQPILLYLTLATAVTAGPFSRALSRIDVEKFDASDIITRDVAIIGGGSSGVYAATRLKQMGQSVVVLEQQSYLGGHTETYFEK